MKAWCVKAGSHNLQVMCHAGKLHTDWMWTIHIRIHHKLATESCTSYSRIATYVTAMLDNCVTI